jgi:lipopolysaccharide transport system permease protein
MVMSTDHLEEAVYTPESQLRRPMKLLRDMLRDLLTARELAWRLLVRNITARYRQTMLGYLWAFLPPILSTVVFTILHQGRVFSDAGVGMPYALYVMIGMVVWQGFVDAVRGPIKLVVASRSMLTRVNFPREALVLAGLGEVVVDLFIRSLLLIPLFFWFHEKVPGEAMFALIPVVCLIFLGTVIGAFMAPLAVLYQDVEYGLTMIFSVWFFMTPVVYSAPTEGLAGSIVRLNPVTPLLQSARELVVIGEVSNLGGAVIVATVCIVVACFSWLSYRVAMPRLIERIGT